MLPDTETVSVAALHCGQALVDIHADTGGMAEGFLSADETSIIQGALDLTSLTARHAMTPLDKVCLLQPLVLDLISSQAPKGFPPDASLVGVPDTCCQI